MLNKIKMMESSMEKWERIIAGKRSDSGVVDCPPCRIYYMLACIGCPIAWYTGKKFCKGTPYGPWHHHQIQAHDKLLKKVYCDECITLATEMRDFMAEIRDALKAEQAGKMDRNSVKNKPHG
jgi:dienelactone hydrolase